MPWMPKLRIRKKPQNLDIKQVNEVVGKSLEPYIKRDELEKYLKNIEKDERKRKIWEGLSTRMKIKVARYAFNKKEAQQHEKGRR
jgi:hypothetical protein